MTAELTTYFNTRLAEFVASLTPTVSVHLVGLVRTVERSHEGRLQRFPLPADESEDEPVIPDSKHGLLLYWEQTAPTRVTDRRESRTQFRASLRLIAWYDSRRIKHPGGDTKTLLVRHLLHNLTTTLINGVPSGFSSLEMKSERIVETRQELFGAYTYDNLASQYMTLPYDAVGIDLTATWWLSHGNDCLTELLTAPAGACL